MRRSPAIYPCQPEQPSTGPRPACKGIYRPLLLGGGLLSLLERNGEAEGIGVFPAKLICATDEIRPMAHEFSRLATGNMGTICADVQGRPWLELS